MFHRSQRVMLRPIWPEDWPGIYEAINDEGVVRNLARAPWPYTPANAQAFACLPRKADEAKFLITLPEAAGAPVVGCIGLEPLDGGGHELGYWVARAWWGRGIATEAVHAILEVARMRGWNRVSAEHFLDNPASGRVLHKAGFRPTGKIVERFSRARGGEAAVTCFAIDLDAPGAVEGTDLLDAA
jgi:RimJ/RimL family protein N-acetyltransferase